MAISSNSCPGTTTSGATRLAASICCGSWQSKGCSCRGELAPPGPTKVGPYEADGQTLHPRPGSRAKTRLRARRLQRADEGRPDRRRHADPRIAADDRVRDGAWRDGRPREPPRTAERETKSTAEPSTGGRLSFRN